MAQKSQKHLFIGGMDLDSAPGYLPENKYRLAKNVQLVVDKDSTQGEIRPVVGLSELDIDCEPGDEKSLNVLKERIIGMKSIRHLIVVITERVTLDADNNRIIKNCIYKLTRDDVNHNKYVSKWVCDGVFNIGRNKGDYIDEQGQVKYLTKDAISIVLRWHNDSRINCYIADGINYLFAVNVADEFIEANRLKVNSTAFSAISQIYIPQPKDLQITTGRLDAGVYQVTYRLLSNSGVTTDLSPLSKKVSIVNAETSDRTFTPGPSGEATTKGLMINLNVDDFSDYDLIEWYVIQYVEDSMKIYLSNSRLLSNLSPIFHFTGSDFEEIELSEFQTLSNYVFIPKVIESKDNLLFAGNIVERNFNSSFEINGKKIDLDNYDTRAWGWKQKNTPFTDSELHLNIDGNWKNIPYSWLGYGMLTDEEWFKEIPKTADAYTPTQTEAQVNKNVYKELREGMFNGSVPAVEEIRFVYHPTANIYSGEYYWGGSGRNVEFNICHTHLGDLPKPNVLSKYSLNFDSYDDWTGPSSIVTSFGTLEDSSGTPISNNPKFNKGQLWGAYSLTWNTYITNALNTGRINNNISDVSDYLYIWNSTPRLLTSGSPTTYEQAFNTRNKMYDADKDLAVFKYDKGSRSYTNPYVSPAYAGYQHDSVYRIAVVFHFSNGRRTAPIYISDIRTPSINDELHRAFDFNSYMNLTHSRVDNSTAEGFGMSSYPMGFEFVFKNLQDYFKGELKAIEIVRAERTKDDRPILLNGIIGNTWRDGHYNDTEMPLQFMSCGNLNPYYNSHTYRAGGSTGDGLGVRPFADYRDDAWQGSSTTVNRRTIQRTPFLFTSPEICVEKKEIEDKIRNVSRIELLYGVSGLAAISKNVFGKTWQHVTQDPVPTPSSRNAAVYGALPHDWNNTYFPIEEVGGIVSTPAFYTSANNVNCMIPYPIGITIEDTNPGGAVTGFYRSKTIINTHQLTLMSEMSSRLLRHPQYDVFDVLPYERKGGVVYYLNLFNHLSLAAFTDDSGNSYVSDYITTSIDFPLIENINSKVYANDLDPDAANIKTTQTNISNNEFVQLVDSQKYYHWAYQALSSPASAELTLNLYNTPYTFGARPYGELTRAVGGPHGPAILLTTNNTTSEANVVLGMGPSRIGSWKETPSLTRFYTRYFGQNHQNVDDHQVRFWIPDSTLDVAYQRNDGERITKGAATLHSYWCNLRQHVFPYRGTNYTSISTEDSYVSTGFIKELNGNESTVRFVVFGGDTYLTYATYVDSYSSYATNNSYANSKGSGSSYREQGGYTGIVYPCESSINPHYLFGNRMDNVFNEYIRPNVNIGYEAQLAPFNSLSGFSQKEYHYLYDMAYDNPFPLKFTDVFTTTFKEGETSATSDFKYDYRVLYSDPIVGTAVTASDPWLKWNPLQYRDVDTRKGAITDLKTYNNTLYFWQTSAFGALSVNDRALLPMEEDTDLVLGVSGVLSHHTYLNTYNGKTADQLNASCTFPGVDVLWYDDHNKEILTYVQGNQELSKTVGVQSVLNRLPYSYNWVTCAYNRKFNEVYITIKPSDVDHDPSTMTYHEYVKGFTSLHTMYPYFYANVYNDLISVDRIPSDTDKPNHFAKHNTDGNSNTFHNRQLMPTEFSIQTTADFNATKTFDNTLFHSDNLLDPIGSDDAISDINIYYKTALQSRENLQFRNMSEVVDSQREETFRLAIPREDENDPNADHSRLKGKWLNTKFVLDLKDKTKTFNIPYVETYYRVSNT